jgi:hypothetical protein
MRSKKRSSVETAEPASTTGVVIAPTGVYTVAEVRSLFRLRQSTLRREIRLGHLAVCRRAGRYFFLGSQLLAWLQAGEIHREPNAIHRNGSN